MQPLCIRCFGKGLCGRAKCPIMSKLNVQKKVEYKKDFSGESPNVFVGRAGYPDLNIGILATENYDNNDDPKFWVKNKYSIENIMEKRVSLVNSRFKSNVKSYSSRFIDIAKEISMSEKESNVEVSLEDRPHFRLSFKPDVLPTGPAQDLKKVEITSNTKIPTAVDKIVSDSDLKAKGALETLYKKGFDEYYLTKVFSLGNFGTNLERKIVPTRWSITATDDMLSKKIISELKDFSENDKFLSFFGGLDGNYYLILFLPGEFSFELFETYLPDSVWNQSSEISFTTDNEDIFGRKTYATNTTGGYYAARLPIAEHLKNIKRQSKVLALRFITPEYYAPMGVWYCRESVRDSLSKKSIEFSSRELLLKYASLFVAKKFKYDLSLILKKSKLLESKQKKLFDY